MTDEKVIYLPEEISVRSLASLLEVDPTAVIAKLVAGGVMATINQTLDFETAVLTAEEFGFKAEAEAKTATVKKTTESKNAVTRAPIVTIMGHVDHGKTSLLDYIRRSNVAAGETGGITQHISAYQIDHVTKEGEKRKITFVDTPGHEAFSALRAHGAALTDIVVLVVAADDGVKPQTLEVIKHAKSSNVALVVAINKVDVPGANIERIKQQLSDEGLVPEEWGGKTVLVPLSAKTGQGVEDLLEVITLTADLMELKADPDAAPEGIVIEGNLDKQAGPVATVLVYNGTLKPGQVVVVGKTYGKVRAMEDDRSNKIPSAPPAKPVKLFGLKDVPDFGERLVVVPNEKVARSMTQGQGAKARSNSDTNVFRIILKADVGGSLAALEDSIRKLKVKDATVEILSSGIGQVTENDINLAKPAGATIISFRTSVPKRISDLCEQEGVALKEYWIIYDGLEFLQAELKRIATPVFITTEIGRLKVLAVFSWKAKAGIVGGEVTEGEVAANHDIVIYREKEEAGKGKVTGLKIGKVEADRVAKGEQCGMSVEADTEILQGDVIAFVEIREE